MQVENINRGIDTGINFIHHEFQSGDRCCLCNNRQVSLDWVKHNHAHTELMHKICAVRKLLDPSQFECPGCGLECDKFAIFSWRNKLVYTIKVGSLIAKESAKESAKEVAHMFMHEPIGLPLLGMFAVMILLVFAVGQQNMNLYREELIAHI